MRGKYEKFDSGNSKEVFEFCDATISKVFRKPKIETPNWHGWIHRIKGMSISFHPWLWRRISKNSNEKQSPQDETSFPEQEDRLNNVLSEQEKDKKSVIITKTRNKRFYRQQTKKGYLLLTIEEKIYMQLSVYLGKNNIFSCDFL